MHVFALDSHQSFGQIASRSNYVWGSGDYIIGANQARKCARTVDNVIFGPIKSFHQFHICLNVFEK